MAFGEYVQTQQLMGSDEGDAVLEAKEGSEGAVVVETLLNMRTVASLSMEEQRTDTYETTLDEKLKKNTLPRNALLGMYAFESIYFSCVQLLTITLFQVLAKVWARFFKCGVTHSCFISALGCC
jgi:hypothetical protein